MGKMLTYKFLEDYTAVIEPYANNLLYIFNLDSSADYTYEYSACSYDSTKQKVSDEDCKSGEMTSSSDSTTSVTFECNPYDEYYITVSEYLDGSDDASRTAVGLAMCMYVRREIRSLTKFDLSATMDAMYALWSTTEEEGQSLYGSDFHNSTYFVEAHHFNAAWQDGDHIHEGMGFLTQHVKITNMFEAAMQAVDPSVSLPYWDFT